MSKYNNIKTEVNSHICDSKMEARRYEQLLLLEQAGEIQNLKFHPTFELQPHFKHNGKMVRAIKYECDFMYQERHNSGNWRLVVEDVKGHITAGFAIKKKLFEWRYPLYELRLITEV